MNEPQEHWTELRISDSDIDAPEDGDSARIWTRPTEPEPAVPRRGFPLSWCVAAALGALLAAGGAVAFAEHRGRTITTVARVAPPAGGLDAGGCPRGDTCSALDGLYGGLSQAMDTRLPPNELLFSSEMIDNSTAASARRLRIVQLDSGVRVLAMNQCRPDRPAVTRWSQNLTGVGPTLAVLIEPTANGCNLAVLADVPAGVAVPTAALQALVADPDSNGG